MLLQGRRRRWSRALKQALSSVSQPVSTIDWLEPRRMMSGEAVQAAIPSVLADTTTPSNNSITLNQHFFDASVPGTLATFNTSYGEIEVALTDSATPNTVANFLSYVSSGAYDNTIFHRSVDLNSGNGASPTDPATIIQGGGYNLANNSITHIPTNAPVNDEYTTELYGDVAGTLAMAKTSYANSATSEWYFNVTDNTELDTPTTDPNGVTTSYTVFGKVVQGSSVISAIADLPTDNVGSGLETVPVTGLTTAQLAAGASVGASNLVYTYDITTQPGVTYNVSSDNKALVTPTVTNGVLSLSYGAGLSGTAEITVTANSADGTSATDTFAVTVPNAATPTAGPVAAPFTAPYTITGTTGSFGVLGPDTDSTAAFNVSTLTIVTQPAHGTATVDPTTGFISYTPTNGYTGPDSLVYTIADNNGTVSNQATVTLDAVPTAVQVNVSSGMSLVFKQPDGVTGHLSIKGGTAVVTFTNFQVTTKHVGKTIFASGAGTDITDITIQNNNNSSPSLNLTSNGPISIGTVTDTGNMTNFYAPTTTLTAAVNFGFIANLSAAAMFGASITIGGKAGSPLSNITIPTVTNSDLTATGNLGVIKSKQWRITDGNTHTFDAATIHALDISGIFDDVLKINWSGYSMISANVAHPTAPWTIAGTVFGATIGTPGANWSLDESGPMGVLQFTGNLANTVTLSSAEKITVAGSTDNAIIQTDSSFDANSEQIGYLTFRGPVTNTIIYADGNIGRVTAPSFTGSRIYAGIELSVAQGGSLAASSSDVSNNAFIYSMTLTSRAKPAFSDSLISADIIGTLTIGNVATSNSGNVEGVSAHEIIHVTATLKPGGVLHAGAAQLKSATTLAAYETKAKLKLGDFELNLF